MTDSVKTLRHRRAPSLEAVPEQLAEWFEHGGPPGWYVLLPHECNLLPARWRAWKKQHPGAQPPSGYEWLDNVDDPRHPSDAQVREARRLLGLR